MAKIEVGIELLSTGHGAASKIGVIAKRQSVFSFMVRVESEYANVG